MSLLVILVLSGLVSVWSQSTLLVSQKTSYDTKLSKLNSKLSDQENKFENRIQELDQKVKNEKNTIDQLQTKLSKISSEDCEDIQALGYHNSGVYGVKEGNGMIKRVYCEISVDGGAWTRILQRQDKLTDFSYKKWVDYEAGFGDPQASHWMGLGLMNKLTTSRDYKLRVDLMDWEWNWAYAEYSSFRVGPGSDQYRLTIGNYSGTAGDPMTTEYGSHNNRQFYTRDKYLLPLSCADLPGWWYIDSPCSLIDARLTGRYLAHDENTQRAAGGIEWRGWKSYFYSFKVATMKIQRL